MEQANQLQQVVRPTLYKDQLAQQQVQEKNTVDGYGTPDHAFLTGFGNKVANLPDDKKSSCILNLLVLMNMHLIINGIVRFQKRYVDGFELCDHIGNFRRAVHDAVKQYCAGGDNVVFRIPDPVRGDPRNTQLVNIRTGKSQNHVCGQLRHYFNKAFQDTMNGVELFSGFYLAAHDQMWKLVRGSHFRLPATRNLGMNYNFSVTFSFGRYFNLQARVAHRGGWKVFFNTHVFGRDTYWLDELMALEPNGCHALVLLREFILARIKDHVRGENYRYDLECQYDGKNWDLVNCLQRNRARHNERAPGLRKALQKNAMICKYGDENTKVKGNDMSQLFTEQDDWKFPGVYCFVVTGVKNKTSQAHFKFVQFKTLHQDAKVVKIGFSKNLFKRIKELEAKYEGSIVTMISVFMCNTQSLEDAWHNELSIKTGFMLETQCLLDGEDYYNALADLSCASEFKIYDTEMYEDCPGFQVKFKQFLAFINDKAGHCTFTCC